MNLARSVKSSLRRSVTLTRRYADAVQRRSSEIERRALEMKTYTSQIGSVLGGLYEFYRTGDVSSEARSSLLRLHCETNGRFTDHLATLLRMARPPRRPVPVSGFLGDLSVSDQQAIVSSIARDGFHVFEQRLPDELCAQMARFAAQTPALVEGRGRSLEERVLFDPASPISNTYRILEEDIVRSKPMQRLMADASFLAVAERYLRTLPILSMVNLWWSPTFGREPGADAAQEYHFDFDPPPIWLLFFVYLTDVGPDNGPHVYVRGSHVGGHPAAAALLRRGYVRIPDEDIAAAFGAENVVEICGKRGTILAVDTRGFHKGKPPASGHRLMMQLTYSCPPYSGAHSRKMPLPADIDPALAASIDQVPRVYGKYR